MAEPRCSTLRLSLLLIYRSTSTEGSREVLPGVVSSFAMTLLIFGSLLFISGEIGQIVQTGAKFIPGLLGCDPGVRLDAEDDKKESAKTGQSIARNVLLGLIGVHMLLALQFRGYLAPITVMLMIPIAPASARSCSSITTVAGLTPLLLEKSLQAQILIPLAAGLAFG